ncbi:MAG: alpha/beta fold hydrolase [Patulibacter minatonensis]
MLRAALSTTALAGALFAGAASAQAADVVRERVTFDSSGTQIVGYHYAPAGSSPAAPLVVIAHGLGGLQSSRLQPFAERFASAGYHALTFDYRNWGESSGTPRNLLDADRQQADYRAAVAAAPSLPGVDARRIVLWGTSLSGGHVLSLGAKMPQLAGVIAQAPHVNGFATVSALPAGSLPRLTAVGLEDAARAALGRSPKYVPLAGKPGDFAALTQAGAAEGYAFVQPTSPEPGNVMTARFVLQLPFYSPDATAAKSTVPTFIGVADADNVTPPKPAVALAEKMRATLKHYAGGHFDVYPGASQFEAVVGDELSFLRSRVPLTQNAN